MAVRALAVTAAEKQELWADLQDYLRELSRYDDHIKPIDGVYPYVWFEHYWESGERWPFWAIKESQRCGFALVRRDEEGSMQMSEFYVRPRFRREGLGIQFAQLLLRTFPGNWSISELRANVPAIAFWRRVIAPYFYEEREHFEEDMPRLEQRVRVV